MADDKKPGIDAEVTSKMSPLQKEVDGVLVDDIRSVQLNEKLNETTYQILHPETDAYQVITNVDRRFVSEEEKKKWNSGYELSASAMHYRGLYQPQATYFYYDVVYLEDTKNVHGAENLGRRYFIYTNATATPESNGSKTQPPIFDQFTANDWQNINFESYLAEYSEKVRIEPTDEGLFNFALTSHSTKNKYDTLAASKDFVIDPINHKIMIKKTITETTTDPETGQSVETQKIIDSIILDGIQSSVTANTFIGNLQGTADRAIDAEKYVQYRRNAETGELVLDENQQRIEIPISDGYTRPYIDDEIDSLDKRIKGITNGEGGAVLAHGLTIQKNGVSLNPLNEPFTGKSAQTVNIELKTKDITDLLDTQDKIQEKWLPDALFGQLQYIGTFNASTGELETDLRVPSGRPFKKGDYAIATTSGDKDPSGKQHISNTAETTFFIIGDWAVYNGDLDNDTVVDAEEWTKVDNTDAVRTVNEQIGNVQTFKGNWVENTQYYKGDIVVYETETQPKAAYVCIKTNKDAVWTPENYQVLGQVYKAADGIELTTADNTFRHTYKDANTQTFKDAQSTSYVKNQENPTQQQLTPTGTVAIPRIVLNDKYGHIRTIEDVTYQLPDDTWRPVNVNGTEIQNSLRDSGPLSINHDSENTDRRVEVIGTAEDTNIIIKHNLAKNGAGSHTSALIKDNPTTATIKIQLGSKFTAPDFVWGDTGHIDSYSQAIFELPKDLIQHAHFKVADAADGNTIIRSFTSEEYTKEPDKTRKFYDGALQEDGTYLIARPDSSIPMAFNGRFITNSFEQTSRDKALDSLFRVLDESTKVFGGSNFLGNDILGSFNSTKNAVELGDTGIHLLDESVVYSAIAVNRKGLATAGGQILEFGTYDTNANASSDPTDSLVIGGLFFRNMGPKQDSNGAVVTI